MINNYFSGNSAFEDGSILYFLKSKGTILLKNNTFLNNSIKCCGIDKIGSVIYLFDPGNISIISSSFHDNQGTTGASIYYSESIGNFFSLINLFF